MRPIIHRPTGERIDDMPRAARVLQSEGGFFDVIEADPPWNEQGGGKSTRGAQAHYPLMKEHEIVEAMLEAPVWSPTPDAHLYLWVTNNHLESGLRVMGALGFRYVTNVAWTKDRAGLGYYFRGQHELCLFGVRKGGRGDVHRSTSRSIPSTIAAKRGAHSQKPAAFYEMVEARSTGVRLSMFSRCARPGWWCFGNEVTS